MIRKVLCIGLRERTDRRTHAATELSRAGINAPIWIDGFGPDAAEVQGAYDAGRVFRYPPCFRCGQDQCSCENKRLIAPQVGTWLSHAKAWRQVDPAGLTLICEDDIKFTARFHEGLNWLGSQQDLRRALEARGPVLVRLGRALTDDHRGAQPFRLIRKTTMSNPCYALNAAMAQLLLESSEPITTTVDIFTHRIMAEYADHFTLEPPIAYELSWSTGELRSDIRPKQVYIDRLERQLGALDPSSSAYEAIRKAIDDERARFRTFEASQKA